MVICAGHALRLLLKKRSFESSCCNHHNAERIQHVTYMYALFGTMLLLTLCEWVVKAMTENRDIHLMAAAVPAKLHNSIAIFLREMVLFIFLY